MIFAFMSDFMIFANLRKSGKYEKSFGMNREIVSGTINGTIDLLLWIEFMI